MRLLKIFSIVLLGLSISYLFYRFLNPNVVHIFEDKDPTKIKVQDNKVNYLSQHIYDHIFSSNVSTIRKASNHKDKSNNDLSIYVQKLDEYLNFLINSNDSNLFNLLETRLNFVDLKDEDLPFLKKGTAKPKIYVAESQYAISLDEAVDLASKFSTKYDLFLTNKQVLVQKVSIKNKFAFGIVVTGFQSSQDARKFCKKAHVNKDTCVVVKSSLDNIQYITTNEAKK